MSIAHSAETFQKAFFFKLRIHAFVQNCMAGGIWYLRAQILQLENEELPSFLQACGGKLCAQIEYDAAAQLWVGQLVRERISLDY